MRALSRTLPMAWLKKSARYSTKACRQIPMHWAHMATGASLSTCAENAICKAHSNKQSSDVRHYAKRQLTWFRREPGVQWLDGFGDDPQTQRDLLRLLGQLAG